MTNILLWKMATYSGFSHEKVLFSIVIGWIVWEELGFLEKDNRLFGGDFRMT